MSSTESSERFGFALLASVAHIIDEDGYSYCEESILYRRNGSEGYPICPRCQKRIKAEKGAIKV